MQEIYFVMPDVDIAGFNSDGLIRSVLGLVNMRGHGLPVNPNKFCSYINNSKSH